MSCRRMGLLLLCAWFIALAPVRAQSAPAPVAGAPPEEVVATLESALIQAMKNAGNEDFAQRRESLRPVVERVLDVPRMSRFLFGGDWRGLSAEDRARFVAAFTELSVATYADRFDKYKGEHFDPISAATQGQGRAMVRSRFTKGSGGTVMFDYLLMRDGDRWGIVNILTDGVSDLALKRSQYAKLFADGGLDAVIARVEQQTADAAESKE